MPVLLTALLRTVVPAVAGWSLTQAVSAWLGVDGSAVTLALTGALTSVYYSAGYAIGTRWPKVGALLLGMGAGKGGPTYPSAAVGGQRAK